MKNKKITTYIFTALGSIFILVALISFNNTRIFLQKSVITDGKIVEIVEEYDAENGNSYQPMVEFETEDKKKIRFVSDIRNSFSFDHVNDSVKVIYNPASPNEAKINKFSTIWFLTIIFGSMGVIFLFCAVYTAKFAASKREKNKSLSEPRL